MKNIKKGTKAKIENIFHPRMSLESYVIKQENDRLYLFCPQDTSAFYGNFDEGSEVVISIYTKLGIKVFNSIIIDIPIKGVIVVDAETDLENSKLMQRRKYIRIPIELTANLDLCNVKVLNSTLNLKAKIETLDIGGGGIRFYCEKDIPTNCKGILNIYLDKINKNINVFGTILKKNFYKKNEYLLLFGDIEENVRKDIIQYCFKLEADFIKKDMD